MPRYIDVDALIEVLQEWRDTSSLNDGAGNPVDSILYDVIRYIEDTPTADVVPRAEVNEAYWEGVEYGNKDGAALVAREIFEEMENWIRIRQEVFETRATMADAISAGSYDAILHGCIEPLKNKYTQAETEPPKGD